MAQSVGVSLTSKYSLIFAGSVLLWLGPVTIKAPRLIILSSFLGSITGFAYCFRMADAVDLEGQLKRKRKVQRMEVINYQFALEEQVMKNQLEARFLVPQVVEVPVKSAEPPQSLPQKQVSIAPDRLKKLSELPEHLIALLEAAIENEAGITVRQAMRSNGLSKYSAEEIKAFFQELQSLEFGEVVNNPKRKDSLVFIASEDLQELSDQAS